VNNLEKHVLDLIGEDLDSPDVFTDTEQGMAQIRDSINDAIEDISILTGCSEETFHIPLRENSFFYRFDFRRGSIAWIKSVWDVVRQIRLKQTDFIGLNAFNPRWLYNSSGPERYCPVGFSYLCIHPAPASSTGILELKAAIIPKRYETDTDRVRIRDQYGWACVDYAVSEYFASRGDAKTATKHFSNYLTKLGMQDLDKNQIRQFMTVKREEWTGQSNLHA